MLPCTEKIVWKKRCTRRCTIRREGRVTRGHDRGDTLRSRHVHINPVLGPSERGPKRYSMRPDESFGRGAISPCTDARSDDFDPEFRTLFTRRIHYMYDECTSPRDCRTAGARDRWEKRATILRPPSTAVNANASEHTYIYIQVYVRHESVRPTFTNKIIIIVVIRRTLHTMRAHMTPI